MLALACHHYRFESNSRESARESEPTQNFITSSEGIFKSTFWRAVDGKILDS